MAIQSYFFNAIQSEGVYDRVYNAEDFASYLNLLVGNGVFPTPSTQLQVRAGSGMQVIVGAGSGWIDGHKMVNTSDFTLTVAASDVLLNRIDAVIFYVDHNTRSMGIEVKTGTVSATPSAPAMQNDENRHELCLAQITVKKQITAITTSMIKDTRGNSNLCGYVQGLIQQISSTTLFEQFQAIFDEWFEAVQSQFRTGQMFRKFEGVHVTTSSGEDTFNVKTYCPQYAFAYDVLEVYINGIHLNTNEYTLTNNVVTLETPIEEAGAVVTFVVYQANSAE